MTPPFWSGWTERLGGVLLALVLGGCQGSPMGSNPGTTPLRDIHAVLADHDESLLAIPGVVGVYVGLRDGGPTTCLRVMLAKADAQLKRRIPRTLEGHPVETEVTGPVRPLTP